MASSHDYLTKTNEVCDQLLFQAPVRAERPEVVAAFGIWNHIEIDGNNIELQISYIWWDWVRRLCGHLFRQERQFRGCWRLRRIGPRFANLTICNRFKLGNQIGLVVEDRVIKLRI